MIFWNIITTASTSECGLVWVHSRLLPMRRLTNGDDISGLVSVQLMDAILNICSNNRCSSTRSVLTFSRWMAEHFLTVEVSCYSLLTQCKIAAVELTYGKLVLRFIKTRKLHKLTWISETLYRFCVSKFVDIDQYLLKLFKNMTGVRFLI